VVCHGANGIALRDDPLCLSKVLQRILTGLLPPPIVAEMRRDALPSRLLFAGDLAGRCRQASGYHEYRVCDDSAMRILVAATRG